MLIPLKNIKVAFCKSVSVHCLSRHACVNGSVHSEVQNVHSALEARIRHQDAQCHSPHPGILVTQIHVFDLGLDRIGPRGGASSVGLSAIAILPMPDAGLRGRREALPGGERGQPIVLVGDRMHAPEQSSSNWRDALVVVAFSGVKETNFSTKQGLSLGACVNFGVGFNELLKRLEEAVTGAVGA